MHSESKGLHRIGPQTQRVQFTFKRSIDLVELVRASQISSDVCVRKVV